MENVPIDLSTLRYIAGIIPLRGTVGIQAKSTDLSGDTTFNLAFSNDGIDYGAAKESGVAITDTLQANVVNFFSFSGIPGTHYKLTFEGETTGNVDFVVNGIVSPVISD